MGMERTIAYTAAPPTWATIRERLHAQGLTPQMRMIDNFPAFPDEEPETNWQEIRLTFGHGMLTLRRVGSSLSVVVWGNAEAALQQDQEAFVRVLEELR